MNENINNSYEKAGDKEEEEEEIKGVEEMWEEEQVEVDSDCQRK